MVPVNDNYEYAQYIIYVGLNSSDGAVSYKAMYHMHGVFLAGPAHTYPTTSISL